MCARMGALPVGVPVGAAVAGGGLEVGEAARPAGVELIMGLAGQNMVHRQVLLTLKVELFGEKTNSSLLLSSYSHSRLLCATLVLQLENSFEVVCATR